MSRSVQDPSSIALGALSSLVGYHIARARVVSNRAFEQHIGERFALRQVEYSLLALLEANGPLSPKSLARALVLTAPNLTLLLDRMQERNLVSRERNPEDGRSQLVALTTSGRRTVQAATQAAGRMELDMRADMSPAEHAVLIELLARLASAPDRPPPCQPQPMTK